MFNRFTGDARRVVRCAEREARDLGSATVEAEHLLLALTWADEAALAAAGLDARRSSSRSRPSGSGA